MPRQRLPAARAEISGAASKNPQRHRNRRAPMQASAVGDPPARMPIEQRAAWETFRAELPWLTRSHRALLQVACILCVRVEANPDVGISALRAYSALLSKLGATPLDECKVNHVDDDEPDPTARFFN
jgi:hypothetical protein